MSPITPSKKGTPSVDTNREARRDTSSYVLILAAMTAATFLVALAVALHTRQTTGIIDSDAWGRLGIHIAEGRGLADNHGRPTAFRGPVLPLIFALAAVVFGKSLEILQVVLCVFFALGNGIIGFIAYRFFKSIRVMMLTMLIYMAYNPAYVWFCHIFTEPVFTALLAMFILTWVTTIRRGSSFGYLATGLLLALNALLRPEMYGFLPVVLADVAWSHGRKGMKAIGLVVLGFLLLEVPWVARNYVSVGKPVVTAANGTQSLFQATWYQAQNWQGNVYHDPARFPVEPKAFWRLPEAERDEMFKHWALENIREAPFSVFMCVPKRLLMFFYQLGPTGWMPSWKSLVFGTILYVFAVIGYWQSSSDQRQLLNRCLSVIAILALIHALLVSEFRYSHPIQPYVFMMACVAFVWVFDALVSAFLSKARPAPGG